MLRPATPLTILLLGAFGLLVVSIISTPVVKFIPLASFAGIDFGVFGFCKANECSPIEVGYDTSSLFNDAQSSTFDLPSSTRATLSSILIVHPIAAFMTLVMLVLAASAHFHAPSHSPRYLLAIFILSILTLVTALLSFLIDVLLFVPHMAWGSYSVLAATILVALSGFVSCAMRRTLVSRKARKRRIAENAEMNGDNFYNRMNANPVPPPPAGSVVSPIAASQNTAAFASFDLPKKEKDFENTFDDSAPLTQKLNNVNSPYKNIPNGTTNVVARPNTSQITGDFPLRDQYETQMPRQPLGQFGSSSQGPAYPSQNWQGENMSIPDGVPGRFRGSRGSPGIPRGGYGSPRGSHPRGGNGTPIGGFESSRGGYGPSRGSFDSPRGNYGPPRGGFESSRGGYGPPRGGFDSPRGSYGPPRGGFESPRGGFRQQRGPRGGFQGLPRGSPIPRNIRGRGGNPQGYGAPPRDFDGSEMPPGPFDINSSNPIPNRPILNTSSPNSVYSTYNPDTVNSPLPLAESPPPLPQRFGVATAQTIDSPTPINPQNLQRRFDLPEDIQPINEYASRMVDHQQQQLSQRQQFIDQASISNYSDNKNYDASPQMWRRQSTTSSYYSDSPQNYEDPSIPSVPPLSIPSRPIEPIRPIETRIFAGQGESIEDINTGPLSPAESDLSSFTSISQRGVNPKWNEEPSKGPPLKMMFHRKIEQKKQDMILEANPDFVIPAGRGERGGLGNLNGIKTRELTYR